MKKVFLVEKKNREIEFRFLFFLNLIYHIFFVLPVGRKNGDGKGLCAFCKNDPCCKNPLMAEFEVGEAPEARAAACDEK